MQEVEEGSQRLHRIQMETTMETTTETTTALPTVATAVQLSERVVLQHHVRLPVHQWLLILGETVEPTPMPN